LLILAKPVNFNSIIQPACLPNPFSTINSFDETAVIAIGWGSLSEGKSQVYATADILLFIVTEFGLKSNFVIK
jgi:hypothetical protein